MAEETPAVDLEAIPQARVYQQRTISLFWLIPLVAAIVAGWLAYDAQQKKGPEITIIFPRGEGIESGKTTIRFKAVEIGQVIAVGITPDLASIEVTARINLEFADHLGEGTRFWVVRPRVGAQGISGLGTLVSGAYIEVDPVAGTLASNFVALPNPPIVQSDTRGRQFILATKTLGSIQPGSVVTFKGIDVGEILGYELSKDGASIFVHAFVREPYADFVRENSRFWLAGGLNVSVNSDGLNVTTPSLQEVLVGAVNFDSPGDAHSPPAQSGFKFPLFDNLEAVADAGITEQVRYVMYFDESVRGLNPGAPIEFRGIKLGEVSEIGLEIEYSDLELQIPVIVNLQPQRLGYIAGNEIENAASIMTALVKRGLRARLQTGNLLTGQLYIDLALEPDSPAKFVTGKPNLPQIPTLPTELGEFKQNAIALLAELRDIPLSKMSNRAIAALDAIERRFGDPELTRAIVAATASFESIGDLAVVSRTSLSSLSEELSATLATLTPGSPLQVRLHETLNQIDAAARALRQLGDELEREPQSVIWGKGDNDE